ncbi:hypothetical protein CPB86DRAFT_57648 [Serendipita vermifera]|nr:hypothetical protein CPB86DRAFT_57648 [Serendipita vermifera]
MCVSQEQFEYALKRAGSAPLKLHILKPLPDGMLEFVASSNRPIQEMAVSFASGHPSIDYGVLSGFNTRPLKSLYVNVVGSKPQDTERFLDLALQSAQKDLHLRIDLGQEQMSVFGHDAFQRATSLAISGFQGISFETQFSLPRVRKLSLFGCFGFLESVRLNNVERLVYSGEGPDPVIYLNPLLLPMRLTELVLVGVVPQPAFTVQLPHSKKLEMIDMHFESSLQGLFKFPRLQSLTLNVVHFHLSDIPPFESDEAETATLLSDEQFYRDIPKLETLFLRNVPVAGPLIVSLRLCPGLRELDIDSCAIDPLVRFLLDGGADHSYFPSLQEFHIYRSWPNSAGLSYADFVSRLSPLLPNVQICGDGKMYEEFGN